MRICVITWFEQDVDGDEVDELDTDFLNGFGATIWL